MCFRCDVVNSVSIGPRRSSSAFETQLSVQLPLPTFHFFVLRKPVGRQTRVRELARLHQRFPGIFERSFAVLRGPTLPAMLQAEDRAVESSSSSPNCCCVLLMKISSVDVDSRSLPLALWGLGQVDTSTFGPSHAHDFAGELVNWGPSGFLYGNIHRDRRR